MLNFSIKVKELLKRYLDKENFDAESVYKFLTNKYLKYHVNEENNPFIKFRAKKNDFAIILYQKQNGDFSSISLIGDEKELDEEIINFLKINLDEVKILERENETPKCWVDTSLQIGSDEVGVGDVFAPICVCATMIKESDIEFLKSHKVNDSKKLSDTAIMKIAPFLIKHLAYSQVSITNEKYNELTKKGINLNAIKAKMHNQVILNLKKRYPKVEHIYLDQFASEKNYFSYLEDEKEIIKDIKFQTSAESYYPSVAAASIIARYSLLKKMEKLNEEYSIEFPLGSSNEKIDKTLSFIYDKYGVDTLKKLTKNNFSNVKVYFEE